MMYSQTALGVIVEFILGYYLIYGAGWLFFESIKTIGRLQRWINRKLAH